MMDHRRVILVISLKRSVSKSDNCIVQNMWSEAKEFCGAAFFGLAVTGYRPLDPAKPQCDCLPESGKRQISALICGDYAQANTALSGSPRHCRRSVTGSYRL